MFSSNRITRKYGTDVVVKGVEINNSYCMRLERV